MLSPPIDIIPESGIVNDVASTATTTTTEATTAAPTTAAPAAAASSNATTAANTSSNTTTNSSARRLEPNSISWTQQEVDWKKKMAEFNPQCAEKPLTYGLGAGVFVRGILKHVKVPGDFPVIGGLISSPDYSTGYQPITSKSSTSLFSSLFPPEICAADLCEGELPGCPPPHIVPVEIPRVIFKMSRPFHWAPDTPMALREFIAYGFAVLPEVVDVVARNMKQDMQATTTTPYPVIGGTTLAANSTTAARRLAAENVVTDVEAIVSDVQDPGRRLEEVQEGETFDEIAIEFSDLTYTIDQQLVGSLIQNRAFDLLDDGRKRELGQIKFIDFSLEPRVDEESTPLSVESETSTVQLSHSVTGLLALLSLTSLALVAGAIVMVRRSREMKEPEDLEESQTRLSRDVLSQGYEPVSLEQA